MTNSKILTDMLEQFPLPPCYEWCFQFLKILSKGCHCSSMSFFLVCSEHIPLLIVIVYFLTNDVEQLPEGLLAFAKSSTCMYLFVSPFLWTVLFIYVYMVVYRGVLCLFLTTFKLFTCNFEMNSTLILIIFILNMQ